MQKILLIKRLTASVAVMAIAMTATSKPALAFLGLPTIVIDFSTIANTLATVKQLASTYTQVVKQVAHAKSTVEAMTSHNGLGNLFNSLTDQAARQYFPDAWSATKDLQSAIGGVTAAANATKALMANADAMYQPATALEIDPLNPTSNAVKQYQEGVKTALATYAGTTQILDGASDNRRAYEGMIANIETAPDQKASTDLNNRLAAQNGLTSNEILRVVSMQANMQAQHELKIAAQDAALRRSVVKATVRVAGFNYSG
jgi:type IV secretion system protein VirB5